MKLPKTQFYLVVVTLTVTRIQSSRADYGAGLPIRQPQYDVDRKGFQLDCKSRVPQNNILYSWTKNGVRVEEVEELNKRYELLEQGGVFRMKQYAVKEDYGNYVCAVNGEPVARWNVWDVVLLPANPEVMEGNKLTLTCKVVGKPYPAVRWTYGANASSAEDVALAMGARVKVSQLASGVPGGQLELSAAERGDAGLFHCAAGDLLASTTVRVLNATCK